MTIKWHMQKMIVIPRPLGVRPEEDIPEQQLDGIRIEQLL